MENELLNKIVKILDEKKAIDVKTIDIKEKSSLADYMVVASGTSITHIKALADNVEEELKKEKSNVKISILCPGPVDTNFNNVADVEFSIKGLSSKYVAKYAVKKLEKNKFYIVPTNLTLFLLQSMLH